LKLTLENRILGLAALTLFVAAGALSSPVAPPALRGVFLVAFVILGAAWAAVMPGLWARQRPASWDTPDRYRGMIEETSDIIHIVSPEGKFLYVNRAWRNTLGYGEQEIASLSLMDVLHPEERERAQRQINELMVAQDAAKIECRFIAKDGRAVWVEGNSTCERIGGAVISRRGIFHDVTERKQAEAETARLLAILEEAPDFIATFTPDGKMLWANRAFRRLRNLEDGCDFSRLKISDFYPEWANHKMSNLAIPQVLASGTWNEGSAMLDSAGHEVPVSQTIVAHNDEVGKVAYLATLCRDITESQAAQQALQAAHSQLNQALQREKELARTDSLTGLANRRAFSEAAEMERARAARYGRPVTLAYVDLDNFKHVNDTLGHSVGDELLAAVARVLRENLRFTDTAGRLGGDEFAILLPETNANAAESALQKLRQILLRTMKARKWPVTFSIGAATFLDNATSVEEMVRFADELMYTVKKTGKNKIIVVIIGGSSREPVRSESLSQMPC
jgi:diguanylate cyclase (GGDEF)-like protein/PAS domain S-box-containing protein